MYVTNPKILIIILQNLMTLNLRRESKYTFIDFVILTSFLFSSYTSLGFKLPPRVTSLLKLCFHPSPLYCYCQIYHARTYYISHKFNCTTNVLILCNATGFKSVKKAATVLSFTTAMVHVHVHLFTSWCHMLSA